MDPIFLNLGLQPPSNQSIVSHVSAPSSNMSQINGIPQESKLATYISNRQQLPPQQNVNPLSQSQHSHQMHVANENNHVNIQTANITKSLAALGLDAVGGLRKPSVPNMGELESGSSLSHSASTPSFVSSSMGFSPLTHPTTSTCSSPIRVHSPIANPSPIRGVSAPPAPPPKNSSSSTNNNDQATYQENVGGTTYFYTAQDMNFVAPANQNTMTPANQNASTNNSGLVYPPYHILPPTPAHVHHLVQPTEAPHFFMGDALRQEMHEKQIISMAQINPDQFQDLPREVDLYHELIPLEPTNSMHKSSMFGYATSVYKATHMKTGLHYCLYRIHGYRLNNIKVTQIVDVWKNISHSSVVQLREVFTTKEFGDNSIVLVYDFHPGSETLASKHFGTSGVASSSGWERLSGSLSGAASSTNSSSFTPNGNSSDGSKRGMLPENTLWTYIIQLTGAVRAIHTQGLACRVLDASKILLTDNKTRIRINCCGALDILNFDPNAANPLAGLHTYQQEDLVNLGKLILSLACSCYLALQRDNIPVAIDLVNRHYSRDMATLVVCLLTSQRVKSINDVMPIIGARFYNALESLTQRGDVYEVELGKELHNGRLYRLISKLSAIVDRPHLNQDGCWSETGDRYMLKLFRDYLFYQQTEDGLPWLDLGHITSVLNKLESGSPDKVCLMSHNEQNVIVVSYAELKRCFEGAFQEIVQSMTQRNNNL